MSELLPGADCSIRCVRGDRSDCVYRINLLYPLEVSVLMEDAQDAHTITLATYELSLSVHAEEAPKKLPEKAAKRRGM